MTATHKWSAGAAVVAVLILVAGWFLLVSPQRAEVAELNTQTESQLDENSSLETQKAVLEQQYQDLPEKQAELAALDTQLPATQDLAAYINEIQKLADGAGVSLTSLLPANPVTVGASSAVANPDGSVALTPDALAAINLDLVIEGSYFEIAKFVNDMEGAQRYTLISGLTIAEIEETAEVDAGSSPDDLTATLNSRIFMVPSLAEGAVPATEPSPSPTTTPAP